MNCSVSNVFSCTVDTLRSDHSYCVYAKASDDESVRFAVPVSDMMFQRFNFSVGEQCHVFFNADNVLLFKTGGTWTFSSGNVFGGTVESIRPTQDTVVVYVKVAENVIIKSKFSAFLAEKMELRVGDAVDVVIKANQIMLGRENKK